MSYDTEKWDRRFLELAKTVSSWSKDPSTKVGAVVVNPLGQIVGTGYNGFPRGVHDYDDRYKDREMKLKLVVHAEVNALIQAGKEARRGTIYIYPAFGKPNVCSECAKVLIQSGVKRVVGLEPKEPNDRWKDSLSLSQMMLNEALVEVVTYEYA